MAPRSYWHIEPVWQGATVYIVAGGSSVGSQNLDLLRGRKVIAINSSYETVPFAQYLFFADVRWYNDHRKRRWFLRFAGQKVTCSDAVENNPKVLRLRRVKPPPGFVEERNAVACQKSSMQGGMNMAVHLGAKRLVLLGADGCRAPDGRTHHHAPHKWPNKPGNRTWDIQLPEVKLIAEPLKQRGIEVINTSPITRIDWWPKMTLEEALLAEQQMSAA